MKEAKVIYSELTITRRSATNTWVLTEAQRQAEEWGEL